MNEIIRTDHAPAPIGPYNQAIKSGNTLYVSGQIAIDPSNGDLLIDNLDQETEMVMTNLKAVVEAAGFEMTDIVKCSIFISDMGDFAQINAVYGSFFHDNYPARETVEVACLPKNVNVEISCIAVKSSN